jgi:hypothetical protein
MGVKTSEKLIGYIGVDTGMVQIGDPCYYDQTAIAVMRNAWERPDDDPRFWERFTEEMVNGVARLHYDGAPFESMSENEAQDEALAAIIVSSGYGDGMYPVFASYQDGRVASVSVRFMPDIDVHNEEI